MLALLLDASKIASATGTTLSTSVPAGVPDRPIPNVYTLPLAEILVGVALLKVAVPPVMDKAKSFACKAPLPPLELNTASLKVTAIVVLFKARNTDAIVGGAAPLITRALLAPRELVAPGAANVKVAALPTASFIVPPFNANADVLL